MSILLPLFNIGGRKGAKPSLSLLAPSCFLAHVMYDALSNFGIPALSLMAAPLVNLTKFEQGGRKKGKSRRDSGEAGGSKYLRWACISHPSVQGSNWEMQVIKPCHLCLFAPSYERISSRSSQSSYNFISHAKKWLHNH